MYMKGTGMRTIVELAPRASNQEADSAANRRIEHFSLDLRILVAASSWRWDVSPAPLDTRRTWETECKLAKETETEDARH